MQIVIDTLRIQLPIDHRHLVGALGKRNSITFLRITQGFDGETIHRE